MKADNRPLVVVIVTLGALDVAGMTTMIVTPGLTARVIPALAAVQVLGFIALAVTFARRARRRSEISDAQGASAGSSKEWAIWLLCGLAVLFLFQAILSIAHMAASGWHKHQAFVPIARIGIAGYLLFLAFLVRRSTRKKTAAGNQP